MEERKASLIHKIALDLIRLKAYTKSGRVLKSTDIIPGMHKKMKQIWKRVFDLIPDDDDFLELFTLMSSFNRRMKNIEQAASANSKKRIY